MRFIALLFVLTACTPWPEYGHGGYAEHRRIPLTQAWGADYGNNWYNPDDVNYQWFNRNTRYIACLDMRFAELRQHGGNDYFPGQFILAEQERNRVLRLLTGGFGWDAERELKTLATQLDTIEYHLLRLDLDLLPTQATREKSTCER